MDDKNFPYTSVFKVVQKYYSGNEGGKLRRLFDIKDNQLQAQFNSSAPKLKWSYYENYDLPLGFIGIFNWCKKSSPNGYNGCMMDFSFCVDKIPIEIIILSNCFNNDDLKEKLLNGINLNFSTGKVLIVYPGKVGIYCGVLCTKDDFEKVGDRRRIISSNLNFFEVNKSDFLHFENRIFYCKLNLENPITISVSKNNLSEDLNLELVKLQKEITDKKIELEMISDQINQRKNFADELEKEIATHQETLEKLSTADSTLAQIQEKIDADTLKLQETQQKLDEELKNCVDLEEEIKNLKLQRQNLNSKLEEINNQIKQRENFALEVENKIAQRIESAKKNVADFICEMAFVNPNFGAIQTSKNQFYRDGEIINGKDYEIEDVDDFIYTLETELGVEGTQNKILLPFSAYLTAAYTNRILLLLVGSNARDIADAFSVTLTGRTAAIFDCSNVKSLEDLEVILNSEDEVISVLNPFAPNFIAYLPELVNIRGKFIFAIYPFVEDLKIEPRSFYNYFLPVFTELIIDRPPTRDFPNRYFLSDKLKQEFKSKYNPDEIPVSAEKRIKILKKVSDTKNVATLFADFPLAYVKGKEEKFIADFNGDEKVLERIREFLGTDE